MKKFFMSFISSIFFMFLLILVASADSLAIEAENFTITKNFRKVSSVAASGNAYIAANVNNAEITNESQFDGVEAEASFSVETTSNHYIFIRVANPSAYNGDSVWFTIGDTEKRQLYGVHFGSDDVSFCWKKIGSTNLEAGKQYTIRLYSRESGAQIDKILITSNIAYIPQGKVDVLPNPIYNEADLPIAPPEVKPISGHPRLLVNNSDISRIKDNLNHPQNAAAYARVKRLAASTHQGNQASYSADLLEIMQSKAFMYLIDNEANKAYGQQAVNMMLNHMRKFTLGGDSANDTTMRFAGHFIFASACVYDWCYDLIADEYKIEYIEKCEELATRYFEGGYPIVELPGTTGNAGHRDENPIFKDLLAFSIAVYDEKPFAYNSLAGVLFENYIPWRNDLYPSGWNHQGVYTYGTFRTYWEVISAYILKYGIGNTVFDASQQNMAYKYVYFRRPDGGFVMDADETIKTFNNKFHSVDHSTMFLIGNLYKDSTIKWQYYHDKAETEYTDAGITGVNAPLYLLLNDTSVPLKNDLKLPYTQYYGSPIGAMVARTGWDEGADSPVAIAVMKPFENYYGGHMHREVGSFQFYYKGMLALDSGAYEAPQYVDENGNTVAGSGWGSGHYMNYLSAPIAHNILAVYDSSNPSEIYLGGQRMGDGAKSSLTTYDDFKNGSHKTGDIIAYDYGPDKHTPEYSYIEGDLTEGYREDRVADYSRSYMFLNLFDEEIPAALIVFDRIESKNANYTKSWLLHSQEEPEINGNNITIRRSEWHSNGRLVNTTLLPKNPIINKVGGEGKEYWTGESNVKIYRQPEGDESGTWRVEINPSSASAKDYFLNVMQVSDNDSAIAPLAVTSNEQNGFVGVFIADRAVFMKKDKGTVSSNFTVTANGSGDISYIITNLAEGKWTVTNASGNTVDAYEIDAEHGVLRFRAPAGRYTVSYSAQSGISPKTFSIKDDSKTLAYTPVSVFINNNYSGKALLSGNTVMISLEDLAKHTNSSYTIDGDSFTANGSNGEIVGIVGSATAIVNGENVILDVAPQITDGVLYVPLDSMREVCNFKWSYDELTYILYLEYLPSYKLNMEEFSLENPKWVDADGNETYDFSTGKNVIFRAKTLRLAENTNEKHPVCLYAAFYNGDQIVSISKATGKELSSAGEGYFKLDLTVPFGTYGTEPRLFVWDSKTLKPLSKDSRNASIDAIFLNGVKINGFNPTITQYNVKLPYFESEFPEIVCTGDSFGTVISGLVITKSDIDETIRFTVNTQPVPTTYTVIYTRDIPHITNVSYNSSSSYIEDETSTQTTLKFGVIKPNLDESVFYDESTGEYSKTINDVYGVEVYTGLENYVNPVVSNRYPYWFYMDIPEKFVGMNYIMVPYNDDTVHASNDTLTFTTKSDVRFYVSSDENWKDDNAVYAGTYTFNMIKGADATNIIQGTKSSTDTPYTELKNTSSTGDNTVDERMYCYEIKVPDGQESVTCSLKVKTAGTWDFPRIFYEYIN